MVQAIAERCDAIEECYEFMLAYAAQGLISDKGSRSGGQLREFLSRAAQAAADLDQAYACEVQDLGLEPIARYRAFLDLLSQDAAKALAVMELVLAQPRISSQLIDNLNASMHLRTLLTDIFLIDEILNIHRTQEQSAPAQES
jgi:hypothetical protein